MNLILVLISVILTIIVLNFHFRGPKKQRVPKWMRIWIIGYFGRIFCFCRESRAYCLVQEECLIASNLRLAQTKPSDDLEENENLKKSSHLRDSQKSSSPNVNRENSGYPDNQDYLNTVPEPAYTKFSHSKKFKLRYVFNQRGFKL